MEEVNFEVIPCDPQRDDVGCLARLVVIEDDII